MSLNIGTLVGYLELDDSKFNRKADQADRKVQALKLHLEALSKTNPKLNVDVETRQLDELQARIADLKVKAATDPLKYRVDLVQAMAELDRLQLKVRSIHNAEIKVNVNDREALAKLDAIDKKAKAVNGGFGALGTSLVALGPALVPITASAAGLVAALSVPLATAGGGLTLFGLLAGKQISQTNTVATQLASLAKSAQNATTAATRNKAVAQYTKLYDSLSQSQLQFIANERKLRTAFGTLTSDHTMFGPINQGVSILSGILPKLRPLLDATGSALGVVLGHIDTAVKSGEFDKFIAGFSKLAGPSITMGLDALGQFGKGLVGLGAAFGPLSLTVLGAIDKMATSFGKFGAGASSNSGVQAFIAYIEKEGPIVADTLGHVVLALVHIGVAAAPWGGTVLRGLDLLAKLISAIPTPLLTPLVTGLLGATVALKAMKAVGGLSVLGEGMTVIGGFAQSGALQSLGSGIEGIGTRLSTSKLAMGSFAAGLAGLTVASQSSSGAVNVLGDTASGALLGFGVGGPIGAAVGGLGGLVVGLTTALGNNASAFHAATPDVEAWTQAVLKGGAAGRDAQRQLVLQSLQASNLIPDGRKAGFSLPQLISGGMNGSLGKSFTAKYAADLRQIRAINDQIIRQGGDPSGTSAQQAQLKALQGQQQALSKLIVEYGAISDKLHAGAERAWQDIQGPKGYATALNKLPKSVQTQINAMNVEPSTQAVINLAAKYHATPKEVQTYLHVLGVDESLRQIQAAIDKANRLDRTPAILRVFADTSAARAAIAGLQHYASSLPSLYNMVFSGKTHKAAGGIIAGPGSGTSDSIPAMVSNGEFVVNAKATAQHRQLLEAINAQHFASGGYVTPTPAQLAASLGALPSNSKHHKKPAVHKPNLAPTRLLLSNMQAELSGVNAMLAQAQAWATGFGGNVFGAQLTLPSVSQQVMINGTPVTINSSGQPVTASSSPSQVLAAMFAYQRNELSQAKQVSRDVTRLRKAGVSKSLIAQMQAAGAAGVQEIHALASGSTSQIRQFNSLATQTGSTLDNIGAEATSGRTYSSLQQQKLDDQRLVSGIKKAIAGGVPVVVVHGSLRPV